MRVALLFAYSYRANPEQDSLQSSYFDIFTAYEYLSQRGFYCLVFDDFDSKLVVENLHNKKDLNVRFLSFHQQRKGLNYQKMNTNDPFREPLVKQTLKDASCLFLYYTGHMTETGNFCFPFAEIHISTFFRQLSRLLKASCQIFCIADSCYSGQALFPYVFEQGKIILRQGLDGDIFSLSQECIYIFSAAADEKAISSQYRSHFTKYIFQQLEDGVVLFNVLLTEVQKRLHNRRSRQAIEIQTAGIACSYRLTPRFWPWVFGYNFVIF